MDFKMNDFKAEGNLVLRLPLSMRFEKLLLDFLRLIFSRSGFSEDDSEHFAEKYVRSLKVKMGSDEHEVPIEIRLSHRPGNIILRTMIDNSSILEEQHFTTP